MVDLFCPIVSETMYVSDFNEFQHPICGLWSSFLPGRRYRSKIMRGKQVKSDFALMRCKRLDDGLQCREWKHSQTLHYFLSQTPSVFPWSHGGHCTVFNFIADKVNSSFPRFSVR